MYSRTSLSKCWAKAAIPYTVWQNKTPVQGSWAKFTAMMNFNNNLDSKHDLEESKKFQTRRMDVPTGLFKSCSKGAVRNFLDGSVDRTCADWFLLLVNKITRIQLQNIRMSGIQLQNIARMEEIPQNTTYTSGVQTQHTAPMLGPRGKLNLCASTSTTSRVCSESLKAKDNCKRTSYWLLDSKQKVLWQTFSTKLINFLQNTSICDIPIVPLTLE